MSSFIVDFWSKIFNALRWVSLHQIIRTYIPTTTSSGFVDCWALGNFLFSIVLLLVCSAPSLHWWEFLAFLYGVIRVFEVFIYQINVLLFDEYRAKKAGKPYALHGFRRIVILSLQNYVEIIFWFALIYRNIGWAFETHGIILNSFLVSLNLSFSTMTNFGYTAISPKETFGNIFIFVQSIIGLFMVLLILARFISLIPKPKTLDDFESD
jgi:hypothetical protein